MGIPLRNVTITSFHCKHKRSDVYRWATQDGMCRLLMRSAGKECQQGGVSANRPNTCDMYVPVHKSGAVTQAYVLYEADPKTPFRCPRPLASAVGLFT